MNIKKLKIRWYFTKKLILVTLIFWLCETIYFLLVYGWHLKAINEAEKICDNIVFIGVFIYLIGLFSIINHILNIYLDDND